MRSLLIPFLSLVSAVSLSAQSVAPQDAEGFEEVPAIPPKAGQYVGVVTITKQFHGEGLSSKVTMKAFANVKSSGDVALLTVVPESPLVAADNPESTLSRGAWQPTGGYLMDGKHPAGVMVLPGSFQLSLVKHVTKEVRIGDFTQIIPVSTTEIQYRLYPQRPASTRRTR